MEKFTMLHRGITFKGKFISGSRSRFKSIGTFAVKVLALIYILRNRPYKISC
jgi:hypothetical protein